MLYIELDQKDLNRILNANKKVLQRATFWKRQIPLDGAREYAMECVDAILSQRYSHLWPDYAPHYRSWKEKKFPGKGYWELAGDLLMVLSKGPKMVYNGPQVTTYFSGIPRGIKGRGGKNFGRNNPPMEIFKYAVWMEFGRVGKQYQPPRPLFKPAFDDYTPKFQKKMGPAIEDIRRSWT